MAQPPAPMIDTHCHLNFDTLVQQLDAVLAAAQAAGVVQFIVPAIDLPTSREVIALAERHDAIFAAVGMHPNSSASFTEADIGALRALLPHPKVVAIGEIGLDYHWSYSPPTMQYEAFRAQLGLASETGLPIIVHNREAHDDTLAILHTWSPADAARPGVLHSFSGTLEHAQQALAMGFYLGFTGPVTYKKAEETRRIAGIMPLDRLLVETDSPYLTPEPHRGKTNTPAMIPLIVERLAGVRQLTAEHMARASTANARTLFNLPET